jgi:hypothetical protein
MKAGGAPERLMISYLLGELSEQEQSNFERACLDDDGLFEELLAVEAELTDDYVRGDLVGAQRTAFEKRLLNSPGSAKQVRLARLITGDRPSRSIVPAKALPPGRVNRWWSMAWLSAPSRFIPAGAAAILVVAISIGLFVWKKPGSLTSVNPVQAPQPPASSQSPAVSPPALEPPNPSKLAPVVATFLITGGGERESGSVNEIRVPAGTDRLRLRIDLAASQYPSYRASLQAIDGQRRLNVNDVKASPSKSGQILTVELPDADLPAGDSILAVTGVTKNQASEVLGKYFIRRLP